MFYQFKFGRICLMGIKFYLLFPCLSSCSRSNQTTLSFYNKSNHLIDSIVIEFDQKVTLVSLKTGSKTDFVIPNFDIKNKREEQLAFRVFKGNKIFVGFWGFHDYGQIAQKDEKFFIYENGIGYNEKPLQKPIEFNLYFYNASEKRIDSIYGINNTILKITEFSPRKFEVKYHYRKIGKNPDFLIKIDGKEYKKKLDSHDFENWNTTQAFLYFKNDSLTIGTLPWGEPLEFIINLQIKIPVNYDSIILESPSITKVYNDVEHGEKKIILNYKTFREHPIINIFARGKKTVLDLRKHDFSNLYYHQKILFLEDNGIRSLIDD